MRCTYNDEVGCGGKTKVLRTLNYGFYIERVRACVKCGEKFRTHERAKVDVQARRAPEEFHSGPDIPEAPEESAAPPVVQERLAPEETAAPVAWKPATLAAGTTARKKLQDMPTSRRFPPGRGCF